MNAENNHNQNGKTNSNKRQPSNSNNNKSNNDSGKKNHGGSRNRSRRRKPFVNHNHQSNEGNSSSFSSTDHQSFGNTEQLRLEQAVSMLDCYSEDLRNDNHREFAIKHIEGILGQWCRDVELQSQRHQTNAQQPPSFAAVAATGVPGATLKATTGNPWQRQPPSVWGNSKQPELMSPTAALIPFGSYRLGVHSNSSDLDLLALAPPYVHRSDFFTSLVKLLQNDRRCLHIHPIPTAYTPVIKFEINCFPDFDSKDQYLLQIDLVFARVTDATKLVEYQRRKNSGKEQNVQYHLDDTDLQDLDEAGVRSLNGARVSQMLLEMVPDVEKFRLILRAVKQWAVAKGIYSNVLGFLGGVNWAILVVYICKKHHEATAAQSLRHFFRTFAQWKWNTPVMITDAIADQPPITNVSTQSRALFLPAWDPERYPRDKLHLMPIITPAYPSMNSSYNVDYPQLRRIQDEMMKTSNMLQKQRARINFKDLFKSANFFDRHNHFLQITISAEEQQDFVEWSRLVESRIRLLISNLETPEVHAWPLARFFTKPSHPNERFEKYFYIGLRFAPHIDNLNIKHLTMDFVHKVNFWDGRKAGMDLAIEHILSSKLPWFVLKEMKRSSSSGNNSHGNGNNKDCSDKSVGSEGTAPPTDDEDDDSTCHISASQRNNNNNKTNEVTSTTRSSKKCRVGGSPPAAALAST